MVTISNLLPNVAKYAGSHAGSFGKTFLSLGSSLVVAASGCSPSNSQTIFPNGTSDRSDRVTLCASAL